MKRYFRSPDQEYISKKQNIHYDISQQYRFRYIVYPINAAFHAYWTPDHWLYEEQAQWCDDNLQSEYQVEGGTAILQGNEIDGNIASFENKDDAEIFINRWYPNSQLIIM